MVIVLIPPACRLELYLPPLLLTVK